MKIRTKASILIFFLTSYLGFSQTDSTKSISLNKFVPKYPTVLYEDKEFLIVTENEILKKHFETPYGNKIINKNLKELFEKSNKMDSTDFYNKTQQQFLDDPLYNLTAEFIESNKCMIYRRKDRKEIDVIEIKKYTSSVKGGRSFFIENHFLFSSVDWIY